MPLTDIAVRNAKSDKKEFKLADERGLYLLVTPSGGKLWRFKYRFGGKEKNLSFGAYPDVLLKDARRRRDEARAQIAGGVDPTEARRAAADAQAERKRNSFGAVAEEYLEHMPSRTFRREALGWRRLRERPLR